MGNYFRIVGCVIVTAKTNYLKLKLWALRSASNDPFSAPVYNFSCFGSGFSFLTSKAIKTSTRWCSTRWLSSNAFKCRTELRFTKRRSRTLQLTTKFNSCSANNSSRLASRSFKSGFKRYCTRSNRTRTRQIMNYNFVNRAPTINSVKILRK